MLSYNWHNLHKENRTPKTDNLVSPSTNLCLLIYRVYCVVVVVHSHQCLMSIFRRSEEHLLRHLTCNYVYLLLLPLTGPIGEFLERFIVVERLRLRKN